MSTYDKKYLNYKERPNGMIMFMAKDIVNHNIDNDKISREINKKDKEYFMREDAQERRAYKKNRQNINVTPVNIVRTSEYKSNIAVYSSVMVHYKNEIMVVKKFLEITKISGRSFNLKVSNLKKGIINGNPIFVERIEIKNIIVIDKNGNSTTVKSMTEASKIMKCSPQHVGYISKTGNYTKRGYTCKITYGLMK